MINISLPAILLPAILTNVQQGESGKEIIILPLIAVRCLGMDWDVCAWIVWRNFIVSNHPCIYRDGCCYNSETYCREIDINKLLAYGDEKCYTIYKAYFL